MHTSAGILSKTMTSHAVKNYCWPCECLICTSTLSLSSPTTNFKCNVTHNLVILYSSANCFLLCVLCARYILLLFVCCWILPQMTLLLEFERKQAEAMANAQVRQFIKWTFVSCIIHCVFWQRIFIRFACLAPEFSHCAHTNFLRRTSHIYKFRLSISAFRFSISANVRGGIKQVSSNDRSIKWVSAIVSKRRERYSAPLSRVQ